MWHFNRKASPKLAVLRNGCKITNVPCITESVLETTYKCITERKKSCKLCQTSIVENAVYTTFNPTHKGNENNCVTVVFTPLYFRHSDFKKAVDHKLDEKELMIISKIEMEMRNVSLAGCYTGLN